MRFFSIIVAILMFALTSTAQNVATGERAPRIKGERLLGRRLPKGEKFAYIGFVHSASVPCRESAEKVVGATREIANIPCVFFTKEGAEVTAKWLLNMADERVAIQTSARNAYERYEISYAPFGVIIDHKRRVLWLGNPTMLDKQQIEHIINNRKKICHLRR